MTTVCTPTPTLTRTFTGTSTSFSTTSTTSIMTLPGTFSVTTITCAPQPTSSGVSAAPACVPTVSTITIPGNTSTVTVPVTVPIDVFITDTTTLFGTACSTSIPPSVAPTTTPNTTLPPPPPPATNPPTNNSSSSVLPSSIPSYTPSFTGTPSSSQPPASSNTLQDPPSTGGKSSSVGPIVGGVVGGLAVLLLLGFFTLRFIKKQHRFDSLFNDKDDDRNSTTPFRKNPLESDFNPAFNYNPIGQQKAPSGITPPSSPPPGQSTFNNPAHGRRPSVTPLLAGAVGSASAVSGVTSPSSSYNNGGASGASTVSSQQALQPQAPMSAGNVQPQGYYPPQPQQGVAGPSNVQPMSYPPKPQPVDAWNPATLYGPSTSNATGYGGGLNSTLSVGSTGQQSTVSGLGYTTSVGSTVMSTAVSSSWGMQSAASSSSSARRTSTQAGFTALGQQQARPPQAQAQASQTPMLYTQYEDPFARSGSPVSIQEQRILQVVNAEPSSPSNSSYALQPQSSSAQPYHIANLGPLEQGLVAVGAGAGVAAAAAAGAGTGAPHDGKGRPLSTRDEKGVHLDGALYQQEASSGPAPPAYQL